MVNLVAMAESFNQPTKCPKLDRCAHGKNCTLYKDTFTSEYLCFERQVRPYRGDKNNDKKGK